MNPRNSRTSFFWLLFLAVCVATTAGAESYVRVKSSTANIRIGPSTSTEVVATAHNGDVFALEGQQGTWSEISMFSGEYRYIASSLLEQITGPPPLTKSADVLRQSCFGMVKAQDRADDEASARFPADLNAQIDFQRVLYDRYELPVFEEAGIAPALRARLSVLCARNNWIPPR
jgi:Bacterial SH3 domain